MPAVVTRPLGRARIIDVTIDGPVNPAAGRLLGWESGSACSPA